MKKNWIILIAVAAAVVLVLTGNRLGKDEGAVPGGSVTETYTRMPQDGSKPDEAAPKKGSPAPAFELASLDGKTTYQVGGKRDKALIVNFWASWCGPCDIEAPDLISLYDKYKEKMDLYAVNATNNDRLRGVRDFVKEKGFVFPVLVDDKGTAGDAYKVYSYPTSFIVDKEGRIVERIEGVISLQEWEKYLDKATNDS